MLVSNGYLECGLVFFDSSGLRPREAEAIDLSMNVKEGPRKAFD